MITSMIAMQIDELCSGKVTKILPEMVSVTLDNNDPASLHISMISRERVDDIEEVFAVGDELKAVVVSIAKRTGIKLSTKALELVPGQMKTDKQAVFASADKGLAQYRVWKNGMMEQRRQALSHLQVGSVVTGTAKMRRKDGWMVMLDGVAALVRNYDQHLERRQSVQVLITSIKQKPGLVLGTMRFEQKPDGTYQPLPRLRANGAGNVDPGYPALKFDAEINVANVTVANVTVVNVTVVNVQVALRTMRPSSKLASSALLLQASTQSTSWSWSRASTTSEGTTAPASYPAAATPLIKSAMKGKKRKGAGEPKQPKPKQPKPKPKGEPDNLGWVGPVSPQGRALKEGTGAAGQVEAPGRQVLPEVPFCPPPFILTPTAGSGTHFITIDTRILHGVCSQLGRTMATAEALQAEHDAYSHWDSVFKVGKLANQGFVFNRQILTDGVGVCVQYTYPLDYNPLGPSGSSPGAGPSGSSPAAGPSGSSPAVEDPSGSSPAAADPSDSRPAAEDPSDSSPASEDPSDSSSSSSNKRKAADIGSGLADERAFQFDPATQMGVGLDPGAIQAVSAASGVWDEDGCLDSFIKSKLTRSQVQHDSGLIQARRNTQRWNDNVKLELQHLAAATPAGTSLVAIQRHVAVTLATWDSVWEEYLHPKWAEQRVRQYGAQEKVLERYFKKLEEEAAIESQKRWGTRKQLVVFFGNAGIGTRDGWGAKAVLQACRKVVERANSGKPTDRVPGKVVTVDEFRTSRVSSAMNSPQPCEAELDRSKPTRLEGWKPQPGQVQNRLLRSAWSKRFEAPVRGLMWCPQLHQATPGDLGKWVDRDCNAALNMQRAGESKWRPLELCRWPHRARLPAKGREYPALGFKKRRDRAPKALAQQPVAQ
ncbi:hypothetical protein QJQ45_002183 [Haematococcus lacustris]|nr:hypothetical protein QJQ45_002183 [Haematococcus lacustris]